MSTTVASLSNSTAKAGNGSCTVGTGAANMLFTTPDYVVFAISLFLPLALGFGFFIHSCVKKAQSSDEFLLGDRNINFVAVALSLLGSLLNGIFVLGTPAEIRYFGLKYVYLMCGLFLAVIIISHFFVPKFQSMKFTSAYEYIERRYSFPARVVGSLMFSASVIIYLAVVLYVPCLAFEQVTNVSRYIMIAVGGVICTIYTTMGGMRAVIYVDAMQMIILLIGLITIAVLGANEVGGGQKVWDVAVKTGRVNFRYQGDIINYVLQGNVTAPKMVQTNGAFSPDPRDRHTFWTQTLGMGATYVALFACNQMMIQRYMSVNSRLKAQSSVVLTFVALIPLMALAAFIGLVINARYEHCDPLVSKKIDTADKIVPYFIADLLGQYHGVIGLLIASIFAAALSSIASVINALAAVFLTDYIGPLVEKATKKKLTEKKKKTIAMCIVVFFGLLTIALSYAADKFTNKLVQATGTIWGVIDGPLAGAFICGFFIPCCNSKGAISGMIGGLIIALWIAVGGMIYAAPPQTLPVGMCNCKNTNLTISVPTPPPPGTVESWPLLELYKVTYGWYGVIGIGASVIINIIVSIVTCGCKKEQIKRIPASMMYSCADKLYCCCPEPCKKCCRCGVDYDDEAEPIVVNGKQKSETKENGATHKNSPNGDEHYRATENRVTSFSGSYNNDGYDRFDSDHTTSSYDFSVHNRRNGSAGAANGSFRMNGFDESNDKQTRI